MRVSIVTDDDSIVIDRLGKTVDCAALRNNQISAVQWYGDHGEIEFEGHRKPNEVIHSFKDFQSLVTAAKPIPSPKPPTPQEVDEAHNRYALEYPDWRRPWVERDAEVKRLFDEAARRMPQPQSSMTPPQPETPKPKPKPKKK